MSAWRKQGLPDGPRSALLTTWRYLRNPYGTFTGLRRRYGDTFTMPLLGKGPVVMLGDPASIKAVYAADGDSLDPLGGGDAEVVYKESVFALRGESHREARKLVSPPFHVARVHAHGALICSVTRRNLDELRPGQPFSMLEMSRTISMDVILQVVLGVSAATAMREFADRIRALLSSLTFAALFPPLRRSFFGLSPWARFKSRLLDVHRLIDERIRASRESPREDILSSLVATRYDDGSQLSDSAIRDQMLSLFVAGHETTATALAWGIYVLHQVEHRPLLDRARAEVASLGSSPLPEAMASLPFLSAICDETLRLYPLLPITGRRLRRPLRVLGYSLPAGTAVAPCVCVAHQREDVFPEPSRFRPERFLGRTYSPSEYFPYGGGIRRCLGTSLASYELKLMLGTILAENRLAACSGAVERPILTAGGTVGPRSGVKMVIA